MLLVPGSVSFIIVRILCLYYSYFLKLTAWWKKSIPRLFIFLHKVVLWYWLQKSCFGENWFISATLLQMFWRQIFVCEGDSSGVTIKFLSGMLLRLSLSLSLSVFLSFFPSLFLCLFWCLEIKKHRTVLIFCPSSDASPKAQSCFQRLTAVLLCLRQM